jgi:hypothetical protein
MFAGSWGVLSMLELTPSDGKTMGMVSCQYVQALLPTLGEKAPGEVDVADEEGGEMDLLPVRLLLRKGNRP